MIRIAIVDDDVLIQKHLKQYIKEYEKGMNEKFMIKSFSDASQIVEDYKMVYDIIFMDIQMEHMDGMTAAKKIRVLDKDVIIIFVTNMADFAIEGYKVDALSYVVKPILYLDFVQQLNKAIKRIEFSRKSYLLVSAKKEILRLDISKIAYLESIEHKVVIHMEDENIEIYSSLKKLEKQLQNNWFFRCNSCYLVSLRHVEGITKNNVVIGEETLPISRGKKKPFMNALAEYIGGEF